MGKIAHPPRPLGDPVQLICGGLVLVGKPTNKIGTSDDDWIEFELTVGEQSFGNVGGQSRIQFFDDLTRILENEEGSEPKSFPELRELLGGPSTRYLGYVFFAGYNTLEFFRDGAGFMHVLFTNNQGKFLAHTKMTLTEFSEGMRVRLGRNTRIYQVLAEIAPTLPLGSPVKELACIFRHRHENYMLWHLTLFARKFHVHFTAEQMNSLDSVANEIELPADWFSVDESYLRKSIADADEKRIGGKPWRRWVNRWKRRFAKPTPPLW